MTSFHEHKLWQDAFVALMDTHDILDHGEHPEHRELVIRVLESSEAVAAKIADALSRVDRRIGKELIYDAVGLVAIMRTQLAIAWGRGLLDDEIFRGLDTKYGSLSSSLQAYR